jgi:CubicO group peptidase (beta-lactamase class C family)
MSKAPKHERFARKPSLFTDRAGRTLVAAQIGLIILIALAAAACGPASPPPPPSSAVKETTAKIDKLFAEWDKPTSPGAALAVIRDGAIVYKKGYGMAKLEDGIAMTPDKIFDIGSVSKQFTATCIVMLVRDGKISLDDDVRKYIPELPDYGTTITLRHLLHHTSGLRDYNSLLELAGFRSDADCPNVDEALEVIRRQKKLNYEPGTEYSYTNTGYFLLGQIVERVSGKSLNAFAQERIFKPLGMVHTIYQDDHTQIVPNRATGYDPLENGKGFRLDMSNWDETGDGNVYTSVEDLSLWDQAFYSGKLGADVMSMVQTTGTLANGKKLDYAFGLVVTQYKGLKVVEHGGSWAGFRAALVRFPEERLSVICLANLGTMDPSGLCFKVADIYLAGKLKEPPAPEKKAAEGIKLSAKDLEPLAGNYQDTKFGMWVGLALKGEGLVLTGLARDFPLTASGPTSFFVVGGPTEITVEFTPTSEDTSAAGRPPLGFRARVGADQEFVFVRTPPVKPLTTDELKQHAGFYVSHELLDAEYQVIVEKDGLALSARNIHKAPLKAMSPDKFTVPEFGLNIEFIWEPYRADGIRGFKLGIGRAGGIEFEHVF